MGVPSVYPTGTTIYDPEKAWNGYTLFTTRNVGAVLINMNGRVEKVWKDLYGFPNKLLPGGYVMGSLDMRSDAFAYQDQGDVSQIDWEGNVVWTFNHLEYVADEGEKPRWMVRQHHDYQREGNPVGYYVPGMDCRTDSGKTLILAHRTITDERISDKPLQDDVFLETDWEGNILWQWNMAEHFEDLHLPEETRETIYRNPDLQYTNNGPIGDWMHINSMSLLGPNQWYDAGDKRFAPENIIWSSREANILAITDRASGHIVWQLGPDFRATPEMRRIGQIIGPHHCHMIPRGLPGEGHIMVFDNGGWAGYGAPSRLTVDGTKADRREYSRILELDPVTLQIVWCFEGSDVNNIMNPPVSKSTFFSHLLSSAQRLPNGNTMITEGSFSRMFEVTPEKEIVWEYRIPFDHESAPIGLYTYRAYRYPYDYVPQLEHPLEVPVPRVDNMTFRMPGADPGMLQNFTTVKGTTGYGPAYAKPSPDAYPKDNGNGLVF